MNNAKLNQSLIRKEGQDVTFDIGGIPNTVTAVLVNKKEPVSFGNSNTEIQDPYLLVLDADVSELDIGVRRVVQIGNDFYRVISPPKSDGYGMSKIKVRAES